MPAPSKDPSISVKTLGRKGVNTDKNPLELDPDELIRAQNAIHEPLGNAAGLVNRPGLDALTDTPAAGAILGGIGVLDANAVNGLFSLYLGRGGAV
jgi:hypothetical protein